MSGGRGRRYKGTSPYADTPLDRELFFGRDRESRSLLNLVLAEDLVVIFAKSGMGKTSLIKAALMEPLRARRFFPMVVRLNDTKQGPLRSMFDGIRQAVEQNRVDCVNGDETSAWHFFKKTEFWSEENDLLRPVLILDQFEELFTLHLPDRRREFAAQLAAVVRGRSALSELGLHASPQEDADPPDMKIVLSLREDFLANLEDLAVDIPSVLHNRFRLGPLSRQAARAAIIGPARLAHENFQVEPFRYREKAVDEMVAFLARRRLGAETIETDAVEPVQLQLICQHVEETVQRRRASQGALVEVTEIDLGGERRMRKVLESFYDRTLGSIPSPSEARAVRRLCEKRLISSSGRRLTEDEEEIEKNFKVSKKRLRQLVDARLLRAEPRLGGVFYELSHDTLVPPILESRKKRQRMQRRAIFGVTVIILLAVVSVLWYAYSGVKDTQSQLAAALRNNVDVEFVPIEAGEFLMGSDDGDSDEQPVRRVVISEPFELGKYEVTQTQWLAVMENNPSHFRDAKRPVEQVSWEDVQEFIRRMNEEDDGFEYRLPTEAEWEYAARAGTTGDYAGDLEEMAWYGDNSGGETHPVGGKKPNAWGLYDMHGNVWEWVWDGYDENYYKDRPKPDVDPQGPDRRSNRVFRGGGWSSPAASCRSAFRSRAGPDYRYDGLGFRLLRHPK